MIGNGLGEVMGAAIVMLFNPVAWIVLLIYRRLRAAMTFALAVGVQLLCALLLLLFVGLGGGDVLGPPYAYLPPAVQALLAAVVSGVVIAAVFLGLRRLFRSGG